MPAFGQLPLDIAAVLQGRDPQWLFMGPIHGDSQSLRSELARLDAKIDAIQADTDSDLACGVASLEAMKQATIDAVEARHARIEASIDVLFAHECEQARTRYISRCKQLKQEMSDDIQREIRRLKQTRDGVSVMDRRRLTRNSGGGVNGSGTAAATTNATSANHYVDTEPTYYDCASGLPPTADELASPSAMQLAEKKRMVVLLSATPIFRPLDKTIAAEEAQNDLAYIKQSQLSFHQGTTSSDSESDSSEDDELEPAATSKRRRLSYDARRLPEGQTVTVYKCTRPPLSSSSDDGDHTDDDGSDTANVVATGVITAATKRQLFLLSPDESAFHTVNISDWKSNRIAVYTTRKQS